MRWWGWGDEGVAFTHEDKPALAPFLKRHIGLDVTRFASKPTVFAAPGHSRAVAAGGARRSARSRSRRHLHRPASTGSSTRAARACTTSLRHRRGELGRIPDVVVRPADEDAGRGHHARGARARRRADPVRRRDQHLRQPRGPGGRAAPRHLARRVQAQEGPRHRRAVRPRPRPARRLRAGPRAPAQRAGLDDRPLPRQLHPLDARRLDRHALVGDAVGPLRRHRRPHARGPRRHARRAARHAPGPEHVDRPERAGDGARERGAARRDHRGDRARAARARASA